jgi:hypothetical protein
VSGEDSETRHAWVLDQLDRLDQGEAGRVAVQPHEATNWRSIVRSRHRSDPVMPPMLARRAGRGTRSHVVELTGALLGP